MNIQYLTLWSMRFALRQSNTLIKLHSDLRIACYLTNAPGVASTGKVPINSIQCSGADQEKISFGYLIGIPV